MRRVLFSSLTAVTLFACVAPEGIKQTENSSHPLLTPVSDRFSTSTPLATAEEVVRIEDVPATASYLLPPTVERITETEAVIFFELSQPEAGVLLYSQVDSESSETVISFDAETTRHQILIEGLQANMRYSVAIGIQESEGIYHTPQYYGTNWGEIQFTTLSGGYPLRVAVIGDAGLKTPVTPVMAEMITEQKPSFLIFTGDVVYNVGDYANPFDAYAERYFEPFSSVLKHMPVYTVPGNHDTEKQAEVNGTSFYYHVFPPYTMPEDADTSFEGRNQWYTVDYGDFKFIMLDTQTFYNETGRSEQDQWLVDQLSDTQFQYKIPVFHIPLFNGGRHVLDGWPVRESWLPLFQQANTPLVLSGHDHNYQRIEQGGITYIISGGGSSVLYDQTELIDGIQIFVKKSHFVMLDFYPDRIEVSTISATGEVLDTTTIVLD